MHYVPESPAEFLQETEAGARRDFAERSFHYRSAPIYLLTAMVGGLLAADLLIGFVGDQSPWVAARGLEGRTLFGFRLALLAAVFGGARILYQTLEGLFERKIGADLALTIAALAAIALGEHTTAALVVFIALCGESIEGYTVDRARRAIRRIFDLQPKTARVLRDNRETEVPIEDVAVGETVVIRPGERIPVDGCVTSGNSTVDESALTGESLPVDKAPQCEVFTGTLNQFGALTITAEKVGEDTTLAQVVRLVSEAAERKAPLERTADRLARLFLPLVLAAAALTLFGWWWQTGEWEAGFRPMLSVLVVACPCPLILATPTAVMAAMAWLAKTGVVVKGSASLERLAEVDTFAFDKTGTLTEGRPVVGEIKPLGPADEDELLRIAAIAERNSEHLLARLIVKEAEQRGCDMAFPEEFTAQPGAGVVAEVAPHALGSWAEPLLRTSSDSGDFRKSPESQNCRIIVGSRRLLESHDVALSAEVDEECEHLDAAGQMVLLVAVEQTVLGVIGVKDLPREASRPVIEELRQSGIANFAMLTGDRQASAESVAGFVGLEPETAHAELFPADKAKWIEEQTRSGRRIAMVGDGVNDAPALATATVGLALGKTGSDIAAEAGDLVLMGDPLRPLPGLLRLARQLVANIRQSIFLFAFGLNFLGMALGAVGVLSPVAAAVFHEISSLAVMINAMRLLWFERWSETRLGRLSNAFNESAEWLSEAASPTKWVFRLVDHWATLLRLGIAAVVIVWLMSGIVRITADEEALVTRFGRFETKLEPGLHWRWPEPFERIHRENVGRIRTVQLGFRQSDEARRQNTLSPNTIEWTSDHQENGYRPLPEESLLLTGDEKLVELTADVQYRIADLREFLYGASEPAAIVRTVVESALRDVTVRVSLSDLLTARRAAVRDRCLNLARKRLRTYKVGVEIVGLNLLDVHPPRDVVPAYRDVANAMERKEQSINEANGYYASRVAKAAGERGLQVFGSAWAGPCGEQLRVAALGAASQGPVNATVLQSVWAALSVRNGSQHSIVYPLLEGEAASQLMIADTKAEKTKRDAEAARDRFLSLLNNFDTDPGGRKTRRELYWRTIGDVLADRPVTILDPKVAGRKHLLLLGPDDWNGVPALRSSFPPIENEEPIRPPNQSRP